MAHMKKVIISLFLLSSCASFQGGGESSRQPSSGSDNFSCYDTVKKIFRYSESYNGEVELIWWPRAFTRVVTHSDLRVGSEIYSAFLGLSKVGDFQKKYERAITGKGKTFFRFKLAVSQGEYLKLKEIVENPANLKKRKFQSCIGGACKMLGQNTEIKIPFPFSQVPTLNALYLIFLGKLGHKKILKVEYVGPNVLDTFTKYEPALELLGIGGAFGLAFWTINQYGEVEHTIIPIEEKE